MREKSLNLNHVWALEDLWSFDDPAILSGAIGFSAKAIDGVVGKVDEASSDVGSCCIVVDTGRFLGKKVLVPAGVIERVEQESRTIYVNASKDEVKGAPEYEPIGLKLEEYKKSVARHYLRSRSYLGSAARRSSRRRG
jgi:hypothetical protein